METGCWRKGRQPGLKPPPTLEPSWAAPLVELVKLVKLDVCLVPTAPEQCITVGPVFRQSDRSQPEHPENPGNQHSTHTSPSQHLHPLSLSLLVCFAKLSWFVSLHPFPLGMSSLTFPSVSLSLTLLSLSPPVPLQLCSLLFSHVSLPVSPSLSF